MKVRRCLGAVVLVTAGVVFPATATAQAAADADRLMAVVRAALVPALPFPGTDDSGLVPANNSPEPLWMVRSLQPGDRSIEVMANPLNEANQARATKAMAQIGVSIAAAQRRSELQYERAIAEAKRTGRSQDVDGVGLSDEGIAGARIDAEAHVTIDVDFNQASYTYAVESAVAPSRAVGVPGAAAVIAVPSNTFRTTIGQRTEERYGPAETVVFFGAMAMPEVRERAPHAFEVSASTVATPATTSVQSLTLRLRGNESMIAEILGKTDWNKVQELLK